MEKEEICRICLIKGVKMYDLYTSPLENYFEAITGLCFFMDLPHYACYQCAALIKKYYLFREKCLQAQKILCDIFDNNKKGQLSLSTKLDTIHKEKFQYLSWSKIIQENLCELEGNINNHITENILLKQQPKILYIEIDGTGKDHNLNNEVRDHDYIAHRKQVLPLTNNDLFDEFDDDPLNKIKNENIVMANENKKTVKTFVPKFKTKHKVKKVSFDDSMVRKTDSGTEGIEEMATMTMKVDTESDQNVDDNMNSDKKDSSEEESIKDISANFLQRKKKNASSSNKNTRKEATEDSFTIEKYFTVRRLSEKEQREEINQRQFTSNYKEALYKCNICFSPFPDVNKYYHHMLKHDPKSGHLVCGICRFRYNNTSSLSRHAAFHLNRYTCKFCDKVLKTRDQAKQHLNVHLGLRYKCHHCGDVFQNSSSYTEHLQSQHPSLFLCGFCGQMFVSTMSVKEHKVLVHSDIAEKNEPKNPELYCQDCEMQFFSEEAWRKHLDTSVKHILNYMKICRRCGETFMTSDDLKLHITLKHPVARLNKYQERHSTSGDDTLTQDQTPNKCEHCLAGFPNRVRLLTHYRREHPDQKYPIYKGFICEICGKNYMSNTLLNYHKRQHSGERPYKCEKCQKRFFNPTQYHAHMRIHTDARPHICNLCSKAFKEKCALHKHLKCHTGEKPYKCEFCGKAFNQSHNRKIHILGVHLKQYPPHINAKRRERRQKRLEEKIKKEVKTE